MAQLLICSACGNVGSAKTAVRGNGLIEIILWFFFIIPGVFYSIWRSSSRHKKCTVCGATNLIPTDSPTGRKLLADQGKTLEQVVAEKPKEQMPLGRKVFIGILIALFLLTFIALGSIDSLT